MTASACCPYSPGARPPSRTIFSPALRAADTRSSAVCALCTISGPSVRSAASGRRGSATVQRSISAASSGTSRSSVEREAAIPCRPVHLWLERPSLA